MLHFWKFKRIWLNVEYIQYASLDTGHPNHFNFKLHNCKSSNFCCCSTHFSNKWEQLGGKIISHVTPFKFFSFFAKDLLSAKSKRLNWLSCWPLLEKKSWITCILINIKFGILIIWVNPNSLKYLYLSFEFLNIWHAKDF